VFIRFCVSKEDTNSLAAAIRWLKDVFQTLDSSGFSTRKISIQ
jgi:hypothetical protein